MGNRLLPLLLLCVAAAANAQTAPTTLRVEGTEFVSYGLDGRVRRGAELVGAELDLGGGTAVRIDAVRKDPDDAAGHIQLYSLSQRVGGGDWVQACEADRLGRREGFPVPGQWVDGRYRLDSAHFALSCTGGAQAKCVRWGYRPWDKAPDGTAMDGLYEACVHMVRGDYCGDGKATTREGTAIDVYDRHGVQQRASDDAEFRFEAGWGRTGAVCVNHPRIAQNLDLATLAQRCPRLAAALGESCTEETAATAGALLFNRSR